MNEFKKTFNATKLNAPQAEEFISKSESESTIKNNLNLSSSSADISVSASSETSSEKRSPNYKTAKFDFEALKPLVGAPNLNDKLAFKVEHLSSYYFSTF